MRSVLWFLAGSVAMFGLYVMERKVALDTWLGV